uniref:Cilia- and flagella-associated protein 100-like n=1 Tax=Ciona intestinalis TaxID=7719 RepID=H2XW79_CIOIN|nr:cilia- and flagella-associated protein 100-like [Ciona intestinalis]|eukprot:XP_002128523.1 cilia- and flagella-associated protein 100-like [Ciona intestinalis]
MGPSYKLPNLMTSSQNTGQGDEGMTKPKRELRLPPIDRTGNALPNVWKKNPFKIPGNIHWIDLCQNELQREADLRRMERNKRFYQKHTFRSRYTGTTLPAMREMFRKMGEEETKKQKPNDLKEEVSMASQKCRVRPVEKEFTHELIQRKREMFLVNFAIKTKRDEIANFKYKAVAADEKLRRRAQRLHEDAILFDEFLKATDEAAVEAMKRTEKETRLKIEKIAELRRMQAKLSALKGDISKKDETLTDYLSYKSFLLQVNDNLNSKNGEYLTSDEWEEKRKKDRMRKEERIRRRAKVSSRGKGVSRNDFMQRKKISSPRPPTRTSSRLAFSKMNYPEEWDESKQSEKETSSILHIMDNQSRLLAIMRGLEEENLKLIYHFQHSEEAFDEMKEVCAEAAAKLEKETSILRDQVEKMRKYIVSVEERSDQLKMMCQILDGGSEENGDEALAELNAKVEKVYYNVVGKLMLNIDGLMMLTNIENKVEQLLEEVENLPENAVKEIQKIKDKERRLQLREEKMMVQKHRQEERAKKAQERANAISFKRVGRRLVFRSEPIRNRVMKAANDAIVTTDSSLFFEHH